MDLVNYLLPKIEHFRYLGYWLLLLISLLESLAFVGLIVPGSAFAIGIGAYAARGNLDIVGLIWFAAAGAILGDGISYLLGKREHFLFSEDSRFFKRSYLDKGEAFFRKHGPKSILLGRFIGPVRPVIPFIAGLTRMDSGTFYLRNVMSAFLWATSNLLAGYFFCHAWHLLRAWSDRAVVFLAALLIVLAIAYFLEKFILTKGRELMALAGCALSTLLGNVTSRPGVRMFLERHPVPVVILKNRLESRTFSGLPLTLLGGLFLYTLLAFLGVIEDIVTLDDIVSMDTRFANLLSLFRSPGLVRAFLWITVLGKAKIVISLALVMSVLFWAWRKQAHILPMWISLGGSCLFNLFEKIARNARGPRTSGSMTNCSSPSRAATQPSPRHSTDTWPISSSATQPHGAPGSTCRSASSS